MTTETKTILPFSEWKALARTLPVEEGAAAIDSAANYFPPETEYLIVYPGDLYIEQLVDGRYHLQLGWSEWEDTDLLPLEEKLYCREYAA